MASEKQLGNIVYQVEMEVGKLIEAQRQVNQRLDQMDGGMKKTSNTASKLETGLNKVGVAIAGAFTLQAAKKVIDIADNMTMLQARVTRLTSSVSEARATMATLSAIASNTGSSLADTQKLWESLTASLKESGATNAQVLSLTDTLQKIGVVGGSSAEEMSNALRQFGQSIAGGIVRAEEFNSVLENMPELARQIAAGLGLTLGQLRQRMLEGKLTAEDALNAIQKQSQAVNTEFDKMPVTVERAKNSLDVAFKGMIGDLNESIGLTQTLAGLMQGVANNLNFYNKNAGDASRMPKLIALQKEYNDTLKEGRQWYDFTESGWEVRRGQAAFELKRVEQEIAHIRAKAAKDAAEANKPITVKSGGGDDAATQKLIKNSERRLALAKLEGEARARLQAQYDASDAGITDPKKISALQDEYAETVKITEARKESNSEGKKSANQAESIALKLENMKQQTQLATSATENLSREQAILRAQQSLGKGATEENIRLAGEYAAAQWDAARATRAASLVPVLAENQSYRADLQALQASLKLKEIDQDQYYRAVEQRELQHQANLAKIRAEQAVANPIADMRGQVDPVQHLVNQNNQKLAAMKEYQAQEQALLAQSYANGKLSYDQYILAKQATDAQYLALRTAQEKQANEQMTAAQWELLSQQGLGYDILTSAVDAFAGNASNAITGLLTGTMSVSDAMRSLGSTILNSVINSIVQMGVEWVKNLIIQKTMGAAATAAGVAQAGVLATAWAPAAAMASLATLGTNAAAATAGITSTVGVASGLALSGMRKNGGPVSAGGLYQVGEGGMPEIYQASNGKQYMIPGDNGSVISNKDMQGGGSSSPIINVYQQASGAGIDVQTSKSLTGQDVIDIVSYNIAQGGAVRQSITTFTTAASRATG